MAKARSSCAASARMSGRSGAIASANVPGGSATSSTAARTTSSIEHHSTRGSAVRASRRDMSSRLSTRRESRSRLAGDVGHQLAVLGAATASSSRARRPAVRIAVSGERRSCETARSSAVLSTSERRSAARLDHLALQRVALDRGAEDGLERRDDALAQALEDVRAQARGDQQRAQRRLAQRQGDAALVALAPRAARSRPTAARARGPGAARPPAAPRRGSRRAAAAAPSRRPDRPPGGAPAPRACGRARARPACWRRGRR